jgi:hypothetical protein
MSAKGCGGQISHLLGSLLAATFVSPRLKKWVFVFPLLFLILAQNPQSPFQQLNGFGGLPVCQRLRGRAFTFLGQLNSRIHCQPVRLPFLPQRHELWSLLLFIKKDFVSLPVPLRNKFIVPGSPS